MTRKLNPGAMGVATGARVFANALAGDPDFTPFLTSDKSVMTPGGPFAPLRPTRRACR